jgi:hypothetical protein
MNALVYRPKRAHPTTSQPSPTCWDLLADILEDAPCTMNMPSASSNVDKVADDQPDDLEFKRKRNRAYAQKSRMKKKNTLEAAKQRLASQEEELKAMMTKSEQAQDIQQKLYSDAIKVLGNEEKEKILHILEALKKPN